MAADPARRPGGRGTGGAPATRAQRLRNRQERGGANEQSCSLNYHQCAITKVGNSKINGALIITQKWRSCTSEL